MKRCGGMSLYSLSVIMLEISLLPYGWCHKICGLTHFLTVIVLKNDVTLTGNVEV